MCLWIQPTILVSSFPWFFKLPEILRGVEAANVNSFQRDRFRLNFAAKFRLILHPGPSYYLILLAVDRPMVLRF